MKDRQVSSQDNDLPAGLSQPAQRALAGAGIQNLKQLSRFSENEVMRLHGIGPRAMDLLTRSLVEKGLTFRKE